MSYMVCVGLCVCMWVWLCICKVYLYKFYNTDLQSIGQFTYNYIVSEPAMTECRLLVKPSAYVVFTSNRVISYFDYEHIQKTFTISKELVMSNHYHNY